MFCFQDIYIFKYLVNPQTSKSVTSAWTVLRIRSDTYNCFFRVLGSISMKLGQILLQYMTDISNLFLVLLWGLGASCRPFNDFIKMTV